MNEPWGGQPVINNPMGVVYTASAWSTTTFTGASAGGNFNLFVISFFGNYANTNGTNAAPVVEFIVKDNTTAAVLYDSLTGFTWTVASGYNNTLSFTIMLVLPTPPSGGQYAVTIKDSEGDGASHSWADAYQSVSITRFS